MSADITTVDALKCAPAAGAMVAPASPPANTTTWSSWFEVLASASGNIAIAGVVYNTDTERTIDYDIGVGAAASEVSVFGSTGHLRAHNTAGIGSPSHYLLPVPIDGLIASGQRVSMRIRGASGGGKTYGLLYYQNATLTQATAALPDSFPSVGNQSITPVSTPWASTAWVQLTSGVSEEVALYALVVKTVSLSATPLEFEIDIATGASGSESVIDTIRGAPDDVGSGTCCTHNFPALRPVVANTRIAMRLRKSTTPTVAWEVSLLYYGGTDFLDPTPLVETLSAITIGTTSVRIRGRVLPDGASMAGRFTWGTDSTLLSEVTDETDVGNGDVYVGFSERLTDLSPNTTYYFRAIASEGGTDDIYGEILSFTTLGEQTFVDGEVSHPLTWLELTDRDGVLHPYAEVDLCDSPQYFGGYKAPLARTWKPVTRGFSDRSGQPEHMAFGVVLSDIPREFRGFLADATKRYLTNRPLVERMIDDEERRIEGTPRLIANGYVSDYDTQSPLQFDITGCDWLKKKFSRKAKAQRAWQPFITLEDFPHAADEIITDTGSKQKVDAVGKAVPIIYGRVSDTSFETTEVVTPGTGARLETDLTLTDAGIQIPANANGIAGASTFAVGQKIRYALTVVKDGKEGPFTRIIGAMTMEYPSAAHTALSFEQDESADSYRVYMFDGYFNPNTGDSIDNTFVRYKDHDNTTEDGFFNRKFAVEFTGPADGNDWFTEGSPSSEFVEIDRGKGSIAPIYVGDYVIGDFLYRGALISRGACTYLEAGYLNGQPVDLSTSTDWLTPRNAAAWLAAGFTTDYTDINDHRYFLIYLKGIAGDVLSGVAPAAPDEVGISVNVWGIEEVGDGTGALITSLPMQYKHFVRNFLAPDELPGAEWLALCPTFPHITDLTLVDEPSFYAVDDEAKLRQPGGSPVEEGYVGAAVIGANGEFVAALDVLAAFNVSCDCNSTFTRRGQYAISMEPQSPPDDPQELTDVISIVEDSFTIRDQVSSEFFNILPYVHTRDYTGRTDDGWFSLGLGEVDVRDEDSITNYDQERTAPTFELAMLRATTAEGAATIVDVMQRKLARYRHPFRTASMTVPLSGTHVEVGDVFKATHIEGIGANGWEGRYVRAIRHELDPNGNLVRLDVYDVEPLLAGGSP